MSCVYLSNIICPFAEPTSKLSVSTATNTDSVKAVGRKRRFGNNDYGLSTSEYLISFHQKKSSQCYTFVKLTNFTLCLLEVIFTKP